MASEETSAVAKPAYVSQVSGFCASVWTSAANLAASAKREVGETIEDIKFSPGEVANQTNNDVLDASRKLRGQPGLCTRCESFPSGGFRSATTECLTWTTPLSRILYHSDWCQMCRFLLDMLCRPDNDPLKHPEVAPHVQDNMRGMSMSEWSEQGWKYTDANWPFGRGELRAEGATYRLGHANEQLPVLAPAMARQLVAELSSSRSTKPKPKPRSDWKLIEEGRKSLTRHPNACDLVLNMITSQDQNNAGIIFATLFGSGNRPGGAVQSLSCFRLRIAHPNLQSLPGATNELWYGNVLDKDWIDIAIGKRWIQECLERHCEKCSRPGWSAAMQKLDFLRVIDVERMCLVEIENPGTCRLIALSYMWGGDQKCKLEGSHLQAWSQPGGLSTIANTLPLTIRDSIEVVKRLGERYLWVDSLCIQQDGGDEKGRQIAAMDRIYGTALLTIVAASGDNANAGLRAYIIAPFESTQDISKLAWSSRGWTFQEKALSRRLLIFCGEEVTWHCREMICREDMVNVDAENRSKPLEWLRLTPQHFQLFEGPDPFWMDGSTVRDKNAKTHLVRSSAMGEYARVVEEYSSRQLTDKKDVIFALQGLLNILSGAMLTEFRYGLPENLFDVSVLWAPRGILKRRNPFPSWSWAGWEGTMGYESCLSVNRDTDGRAISAKNAELGEEGIRPLIYWYALDASKRGFRRLNTVLGTLPEIPREWEGRPYGFPQSTQLETEIVDELSGVNIDRHHLVFRTSCANCKLRLGKTTDGSYELTAHVLGPRDTGGPLYADIKDSGHQRVGHIVLDTEPPAGGQETVLVVIAESQPFHLGFQFQDAEEYSCYRVMLLLKPPNSNIFERLGLGNVWKTAWIFAQPSLRTIVLG
ncbi:unnamed protein product [Clonostachys solani]|uniref:Heterokaryon incompatibility domain-containing protein n=1 Tax=Clonostachys solani TaxID=160281 RepID=A0A9N9ZC30_9HYPO|nr:unnamed protein product [Clonostachys solani]